MDLIRTLIAYTRPLAARGNRAHQAEILRYGRVGSRALGIAIVACVGALLCWILMQGGISTAEILQAELYFFTPMMAIVVLLSPTTPARLIGSWARDLRRRAGFDLPSMSRLRRSLTDAVRAIAAIAAQALTQMIIAVARVRALVADLLAQLGAVITTLAARTVPAPAFADISAA